MATAVKSPKKVYRALLIKKREEILVSVKSEPEDALSTNIRTPDEGEFAKKAADQAVAAATMDLRFRLLKDIDGALDRVNRGTYGTCERCSEEILPNRLRAIPWARYCLSCEEGRSKN